MIDIYRNFRYFTKLLGWGVTRGAKICSEWRGLLNPRASEFRSWFYKIVIFACLGHGIVNQPLQLLCDLLVITAWEKILLWRVRLPSGWEKKVGLTLSGLQSRFGDKLLEIWAVCPHNGTAVLKGLKALLEHLYLSTSLLKKKIPVIRMPLSFWMKGDGKRVFFKRKQKQKKWRKTNEVVSF